MHIIGRNFSFKKTIVLFLFLSFCAVLSAQTIKYVTFFPTPHVYYSSINANTALLGTRGEVNVPQNISPSGRIEIGYVDNGDSANVLTVNETFYARNLNISLNAGTSGTESGGTTNDLHVGYYNPLLAQSSFSEYEDEDYGTLNVFNKANDTLTIGHLSSDKLKDIRAYNELSVKDICWSGKGCLVGSFDSKNIWSSECTSLKWKTLHIQQVGGTSGVGKTDSMQTYLVCCPGSYGC